MLISFKCIRIVPVTDNVFFVSTQFELLRMSVTVKFLNFRTPKIFAFSYLKFKQEAKP